MRLGQPDRVWPLLKHSTDPRLRSYLVHRFAPLGADPDAIVRRIGEEVDITIRRALVLSLGEYGEQTIAAHDREVLAAKLKDLYRHDPDAGLHAATEWLLRQWHEEPWLKQVNDEWAKNRRERDRRLESVEKDMARRGALVSGPPKTWPRWFINSQGQTMVAIPGPVEFQMGSPVTEVGRNDEEEGLHWMRIRQPFVIAAKFVTIEQYRKFEPGYAVPPRYMRLPDMPAGKIDWYHAARYCNWLSEVEGIAPEEWCYVCNPKEVKPKANYLSLRRYRLPTEPEIEYATRAGAATARYYGETAELLKKYAWYGDNSGELTWPVGRLKPNDFGLFDAHGNVQSWCQERFRWYPQGDTVSEDREDPLPVSDATYCVQRGGSYFHRASCIRSAQRMSLPVDTHYYDNSFRPTRTLTAHVAD